MSDLVHVPPLNTLIGTETAVDAMVGEVAGLIGGDNDPSAQDKAVKLLDRSADLLNMGGVYLWTQKEVTWTLTNGDTTVDLPDDWGWPDDSLFAFDSNSRLIQELRWVSYTDYRRIASDSASARNAVPEVASILSEFDDVAHIYPPANASKAATLKGVYFVRIARPSENSTLWLTPEAREAMIQGGEYLVMRYRFKNQPRVWMPFRDTFKEAMIQARSSAARRKKPFHGWAVPEDGYNWNQSGTPYVGGRGSVLVEI